jgi:hypothetical protein
LNKRSGRRRAGAFNRRIRDGIDYALCACLQDLVWEGSDGFGENGMATMISLPEDLSDVPCSPSIRHPPVQLRLLSLRQKRCDPRPNEINVVSRGGVRKCHGIASVTATVSAVPMASRASLMDCAFAQVGLAMSYGGFHSRAGRN